MDERKVKSVKPTLNKESLDYINNIGKKKGTITKSDIKEYIKYALGDKEDKRRETFCSFIAVVDKFKRSDERFIIISKLHVEATKSNKIYIQLYKETSEKKSEMYITARQMFEWNKQNVDFDFFK